MFQRRILLVKVTVARLAGVEPRCRNAGLSIIRHLQSAAAHYAPLISVTGRNGEAVINYRAPGSGDRSALSLVRFVPNDSSTPRVRRRPSLYSESPAHRFSPTDKLCSQCLTPRNLVTVQISWLKRKFKNIFVKEKHHMIAVIQVV